jgi:hypothetical protein
MNAWQAFRTGLHRATRYWQVWLAVYAAHLLAALVLVALPALSLVSGPGHRPAIRYAADGLDAWLVIEILMSPMSLAALGETGMEPGMSPALQEVLLVGLVTAAATSVLAWFLSSFLSGGLLLTYAEAPRAFRWRRYLWGCWHWFGTFLLLGVVQALGWAVTLVPGAILVGAASSVGPWLAWLLVAVLGLALILWWVLVEYSRINAVAGETQNLFLALGRSARFLLRRPLAVAGLLLLSLIPAALLHGLFRYGLLPRLPLDLWFLVLLVQQIFILGRLGIRLVRLAGGMALVAVQPPVPDGSPPASQPVPAP